MDAQLTFADPAEGDCLLSAEMLKQAGECHELELPALVARVGKTKLWDAIANTVVQAMKQWAVDDAEAGFRRRYSVWVAQKRGANAANEEVPLALVYVVEHPLDDSPNNDEATEAQSAQVSAFNKALSTWPEYARMEYANPLWDGARPWYLVSDRVATRIDQDSAAYRSLADCVLAEFWQDQYILEQAAGDAFYADDDGSRMGRGALAYLRRFVRQRHCFTMYDLPGDVSDPEAIPQWISDYFDDGGMLLHTQDYKRSNETVLLALTEYPDLVAEAPVSWSFEFDDASYCLVHLLIFEDPDEGDLNCEFIYDLGDRTHLDELAGLAVQDEHHLHILTRADGGGYRFAGTRTLSFDDSSRMDFARIVAPVVLECAPHAQVRVATGDAPLSPVSAAAAEPEEPAAQEHLASLELKESRVAAVRLLCQMGDVRYAAQICDAVEKMTWAEVDQVWEDLPMLGEAAVEEFVRLTQNPNRKAAAACGMRALGRVPCPRSLEVLAALVRTLGSKAEPTEALVDLGDYAVPALLELSRDPKGEVRQMAVYALGKIGAPGVRDRVLDMAEADRSTKVRRVAETALAWINGEEECDMDLRDFFGNIELQ